MAKLTEAQKQANERAISLARTAAEKMYGGISTVSNGFTVHNAEERRAYCFQLNGVIALTDEEALNTYGAVSADGKSKTGGNKSTMAESLLDKVQAAFPQLALYNAVLQDSELIFSPSIFLTDNKGNIKNAPMRRCFDKFLNLGSQAYEDLTETGITPVLDKMLADASTTDSIIAYMKACYRNGYAPALTTTSFDYMLFYLEGAAARYVAGDNTTYEEWRDTLAAFPMHTVTTQAAAL